jgi:hypothetical protein
MRYHLKTNINYMRSPLFLLFVLAMFGLMAVSCRKGELPNEYYFGKLGISLVALPNTPDIEVHFNGKKLTDNAMIPGESRSFDQLSQEGKLEIFKAHTDSLLGDTLITIPPNAIQNFRFAYSEAFGLQGFVAGGEVAADSIKLQFLNNLGEYYNAYPSVDLHIGYYDGINGGYAETGVVIKNFSKGQLSPEAVTLPIATADGSPIFYFGRLKNAETGEFILSPGGTEWFFITGFFAGGNIHVLRFYDASGEVSVEDITI